MKFCRKPDDGTGGSLLIMACSLLKTTKTYTHNLNLLTSKVNGLQLKETTKPIYEDVVCGGFVRIKKFFELIQGMTRSQLYQIANRLDHDLKGKYDKTFDQNTTKDFIRLRNFLKIYKPGIKMLRIVKKDRDRKFGTEVLDEVRHGCKSIYKNIVDAINLPSNMQNMITKATHAFQSIDNTALSLDKIITMINTTIDSISIGFAGMRRINILLLWITKLLSFLHLIHKPENQDISSIASLITLFYQQKLVNT